MFSRTKRTKKFKISTITNVDVITISGSIHQGVLTDWSGREYSYIWDVDTERLLELEGNNPQELSAMWPIIADSLNNFYSVKKGPEVIERIVEKPVVVEKVVEKTIEVEVEVEKPVYIEKVVEKIVEAPVEPAKPVSFEEIQTVLRSNLLEDEEESEVETELTEEVSDDDLSSRAKSFLVGQ